MKYETIHYYYKIFRRNIKAIGHCGVDIGIYREVIYQNLTTSDPKLPKDKIIHSGKRIVITPMRMLREISRNYTCNGCCWWCQI